MIQINVLKHFIIYLFIYVSFIRLRKVPSILKLLRVFVVNGGLAFYLFMYLRLLKYS